jgi:hypothetical protein
MVVSSCFGHGLGHFYGFVGLNGLINSPLTAGALGARVIVRCAHGRDVRCRIAESGKKSRLKKIVRISGRAPDYSLQKEGART